MPLSRRHFLLGGASAALFAACTTDGTPRTTASGTSGRITIPDHATLPVPPGPTLPGDPFTLGVASGDPDTTSVVLWTRLAPVGAMPDEDVALLFEVARDKQFQHLAQAGNTSAPVADAHSVHVVAGGLEPATTYWYRFRVGEHTSPVGRTVTAPKGDSASLRFAFVSCQDYQDGYYTAHANLAKEDVDLVVFLGDYIYESGVDPKAVRQHEGPEVISLEQYRARYARYKSDPHLQAVHARAPWFVIWDDHEVDNNYANLTPELNAPKVDFAARRAAAYQAWWEHQPTRLPRPSNGSLVAYRPLPWGNLVTFFGLDGRQYRDDQPCGRSSDLGETCADRDRPERTMLGAEQEAWIGKAMPASTSTWNVVANQTIFSPSGIPLGSTTIYNLDQWDGYPAARDRMLEVLAKTKNPVIVTGDIHASAVADFRRGDAVIGTELVGTSITSSFPAALASFFEGAAKADGAKMADAAHHGYVVCAVSPQRFEAHYRNVGSTQVPTSPATTASSWAIAAGKPGVASA